MSWLRFLPGIMALELIAATFAYVWVQPAANDALLLPLGLIVLIVTLLAALRRHGLRESAGWRGAGR